MDWFFQQLPFDFLVLFVVLGVAGALWAAYGMGSAYQSIGEVSRDVPHSVDEAGYPADMEPTRDLALAEPPSARDP